MSHRLPQRLLSTFLASLVVLLSAGLTPYEAVAAVVHGKVNAVPVNLNTGLSPLSVPTVSLTPSPLSASGLTLAPSLAPALGLTPLLAPSVLPTASVVPAAIQPVVPAMTSQAMLQTAAQDLGKVSDSPSAQSSVLSQLFTGSKQLADLGGEVSGLDVPSLTGSNLPMQSVPQLQAIASDSTQKATDRSAAVAALAKSGTEESRQALKAVGYSNPEGGAADYEVKRQALKSLADQGVLLSMPPVSAAHAEEIMKKLSADKPQTAAIDYDGTLEDDDIPASRETAASLKALSDAGVETMVLTARSDVKSENVPTTILDSLSSLTPAQKSSIVIGADRGARILIYDKKGGARLLKAEPVWTQAERQAIQQASDIVSARFGVGGYQGRTELLTDYRYELDLAHGLTPAQVMDAAALMDSELRSRGVKVKVVGRDGDGGAQSPYLHFSKVEKNTGVLTLRKDRELLGRLRDALRLGLPAKWFGAARKGLGLLPRPVSPAAAHLSIGDHFFGSHGIDSPMAQGAPGSMTIAVGESLDPRIENAFLWPVKNAAGTRQVMQAVAKPATGADVLQKKVLIGMFSQRTVSIVAFLLTAIAYPFIAIPVVGVAGFGALMALGPLAAIATGPLNGLIAKKLSARNAMAVNTIVRVVLALIMPAFSLMGAMNFTTLLIASIANGWLLSSIMTTENIYIRRFSGKHLGSINALAMINYLAVQAVLGLIIGVGAYVGHWNPMLPYYISAAAHALIVLPIVWKTIPNVIEGASTSSEARVPLTFAQNAKAKLQGIGQFFKKYWKEALLFVAGVAAFPVLHTTIPAALALIYWLGKTPGFKDLWANKPLRYAVLFASLAAFLFFPLQSFSLPLIAQILAGASGKALLLGQLLGALFFGQLISNASQAKLPVVRVPLLGRVGLQRVVQGVVLALGAAWVYLGLFPGSLLAAGIAVAAGAALMYISGKFTNRGWIRFMGIGLSALLLPLLAWGNVPLLFASLLLLGFFYGPGLVSLTTYFFSKVPKSGAESMIAIQGSLFNAAISLGYGVLSLLAGLANPVFPTMLIPVGIAFVLAGILFAFAPKLMPGLPETLFNRKAKEAEKK